MKCHELVLARLCRSEVIVTNTKPPIDINPIRWKASTVNRYPVALSPLDIDQVMQHVQELYVDRNLLENEY